MVYIVNIYSSFFDYCTLTADTATRRGMRLESHHYWDAQDDDGMWVDG